MIPLPFWLTNLQFVIGALGTFAFFAAAWLNVDAWTIRRELKTSLRVAGFFLLAIWSALHATGTIAVWVDIAQALALAAGSLLIMVSYVMDKPPLQPKDLAKLRISQKEKIAKIVKGPSQTKPTTAVKPQRPNPQSLKPALQAKRAIRQSIQKQTPLPKRNLKPQTLLKLPPVKRKRTSSVFNFIVGILTFAAIGYGGYFAYDKYFAGDPPAEQPAFVEETTTPEPTPAPTPETTSEPEVTVTIQDTETGFLNVRDGSSTASEILTTIAPGDSFDLITTNEAGDWTQIQVDQNTAGWVASRYVTKD